MTTLTSIFLKPVDRPIEGVIKADDEASLRTEIEEYVLTREAEKQLGRFLDAYCNYEGANGVWISGFFGSGKSHLLKMLALLLENREIDGSRALELFKGKCGENEILRGDLIKAASTPSKSILFNIDQKADVISKGQLDALLAVFVKVFDEMCGYYGKQGHIAKFERDLDSRGVYVAFKSAYEDVAGKPWHRGREQALLESKNIARAYAKATGEDDSLAVGILDKYRSTHRVSIEDFAEQVQAFIEAQAPGFRLNFFVDEIGQYIADNVKLMTNLQTIAESLATKCRGQAWIIVTAQEDMTNVVGEMTKQQGNDFSKIQDRFKNRLKLTSQDVAEVIQRRLLMKNDVGIERLTIIYHAQANNFKTLFDFGDGSQTYKNFRDRDHFIHSYPFIPYQYALFQAAILNLSRHNAFEGKHSSVGERSMLGVFQQVAIEVRNHEVGQLATFDLMFDGLRTALKSNIQQAILRAENHLENRFAVQVLKALLLVKYVKEFKATVRNLCVLMLGNFQVDLPALRQQVEEALDLLEQQTYIQRSGDLYEYLTEEEYDVEQEIKHTEVDTSEVAGTLEDFVFNQVIKQKKIRHAESGQDYPYSRKLDDRLHGREYELAIHVVSPFAEHAGEETVLKMQSMGRSELLVVMPQDTRLMQDLLMLKRTEKYIKQNISITQQDSVKRILESKRQQLSTAEADLRDRIKALLGKAKLFVDAHEIELGVEDATNRVVRGFHDLIARSYPNLRMLRGITYTEQDVAKYLKRAEQGLFQADVLALSEAEQELLALIQGNGRSGVRTTLRSLVERFERKPNGWPLYAVLSLLASLCARGKVEVRLDGNLLEDAELAKALLNTQGHGNVVLEPQVEFTAAQIRGVRDFYAEFFDGPSAASEAKALGSECVLAVQRLLQELLPLQAQAPQYPFLSGLSPVIAKLKEIATKPYVWFLVELPKQEDALLDLKEQLIDPIRKFMSGSQRAIFDEAREFLEVQAANQGAIEGPEMTELREVLANPTCYKGNQMQQAKALVESLKVKVDALLALERGRARDFAGALKVRLTGMAEYAALTPDQQAQLTKPFDTFENLIEAQKLVAVIRDAMVRFEEKEYPTLLSRLSTWSAPRPEPEPVRVEPEGREREDRATPRVTPEPAIEYLPVRSVKVAFYKAWLADEDDVKGYLASMEDELLKAIRTGKRIQI